MYLLTVMPVERRGVPESLTFFAREAPPIGSIVEAPVQSRTLPALVVDVIDATAAKLDVKSSPFALRKIDGATGVKIFSDAFIAAIGDVSSYHMVPRAHTLAQLSFRSLLSEAKSLPAAPSYPQGDTKRVPRLLQADHAERMAQYRNMARHALAEKSSLLIIAPSLIEVETIFASLSRGISEHVALLASTESAHKLATSWARAVSGEARIIVGTPAALSCPIGPRTTIVLERESARTYRSRHYPFVDARRLAHALQRALGAELVIADFPLRIETRYLQDVGLADDSGHAQLRPQSHASVRVVNPSKVDEPQRVPRVFKPFTTDSARAIAATVDAGRTAVVFASRKGIAPLTVCGDCGASVIDPVTKTPMSLHRSPSGNIFLSHRTGAIVPALAACTTCGGWNLVTLGIGVDRVYDELTRFIPREKVTLFTSDTAATHARAKQLTAPVFAHGGVLVGTERMLPYITEPVALTVVASIDSMLALPQWRADEHALRTLFALREKTEELMIVETRRSEHPVMQAIESGDAQTFYRAAISEREVFRYPPFVTFIGLMWSGTEEHTKALGAEVKRVLKGFDLVGPLTPEMYSHSSFSQRALVRASVWPHKELESALELLPADVVITVDPEEIV